MNLRTRLVLALLACALLPVTGAGLFARPVLTQYFERTETRRRDAAIARVDRAIATRADGLTRTLARFCAHDYLVDRALLQVQAGQFTAASRDELAAVLPEVATALGLDTLAFVRETGEVLASAHYPGRAGSSDPATFRAASSVAAGQSARAVRTVRVRGDAGPRDILALEALCVARRGPVAIAVAGGLALDDRLVTDARDEGLTVQVVPGDARPPRAPGVTTRVLPLRGEGGVTAASVVVSTSDAQLRAVLADLDGLVALAAIFAASIAVLLALLLASPLARPISEVAAAADRIAQGTRSIHIDARAGGEAGRLVRAFNHMARELDAAETRLRRAERVAAWRDIARQMAHEIKNPLTPIQMAVEMLRKARERNLPDFEQLFDEETRIVLEEVARLRRLVENFSRFARAPRPRLEQVNVTDVVAHVVGLHATAGGDWGLRPQLGAESPQTPVAEVTGEAEPDLPAIRADREQLTQVLVNLVGNAAFAAAERAQKAPDKGPAAVHVSARNLRDGRIAIAVDDNGAGIDPAVMDRLFEPYVTTKQGQGGTGLGLAIAFRIVTDHGGTISPETSPEGTRFEVILPIAGPSQQDLTLDSEDRRHGGAA